MTKEEIIQLQKDFIDKIWDTMDKEVKNRVLNVYCLDKEKLRESLFINNRTKRLSDNAYMNLNFSMLFQGIKFIEIKLKRGSNYHTIPKYIRGLEELSIGPYYLGQGILIITDNVLINLYKIHDDPTEFMKLIATKPTNSM